MLWRPARQITTRPYSAGTTVSRAMRAESGLPGVRQTRALHLQGHRDSSVHGSPHLQVRQHQASFDGALLEKQTKLYISVTPAGIYRLLPKNSERLL